MFIKRYPMHPFSVNTAHAGLKQIVKQITEEAYRIVCKHLKFQQGPLFSKLDNDAPSNKRKKFISVRNQALRIARRKRISIGSY